MDYGKLTVAAALVALLAAVAGTVVLLTRGYTLSLYRPD